MQTQSYDLEGLAQSNAVLTISNSEVMAQFAHMTVTMNSMQTQLKTLASSQTNQTSSNRKHNCWSCGSKYNQGCKTCSSNKSGHQYGTQIIIAPQSKPLPNAEPLTFPIVDVQPDECQPVNPEKNR